MAHRNDRAGNEAQIRQLIGDRTEAIRAKDVDAAMASYAPDLLLFDLAPPLQYRVAAVNRKSLKEWFASFQGPVGYEIRDLTVAASDEVAFGHGLSHMSGTRTDGTETDVWVRTTLCLRRIDGKWMITHEHVSVPFEMTPPFRASLGLKP